MKQPRKYWFKAKADGLGWSTPLTWQGWLVYIAMFAGVGYFFITGQDVGRKMIGVWVPILVCMPLFWLFGEPLGGGKSRGPDSR